MNSGSVSLFPDAGAARCLIQLLRFVPISHAFIHIVSKGGSCPAAALCCNKSIRTFDTYSDGLELPQRTIRKSGLHA
jgi:hypothetical protein